MKQLEQTTLQFYSHAVDTYNDDELNRYLFDLQTAVDASKKESRNFTTNKQSNETKPLRMREDFGQREPSNQLQRLRG